MKLKILNNPLEPHEQLYNLDDRRRKIILIKN